MSLIRQYKQGRNEHGNSRATCRRFVLLERLAMAVEAKLLIAILLPKHSTPVAQAPQQQLQTVKRVAYLANELDYPESWARQRFTPYISDGVLYLPLQVQIKDS